MSASLEPVEDQHDDEEVDVDLDALDDTLREERIGEPTIVRIKGHVIHILHAGDWSSAAMRAASGADWDTWASEVIPDENELAQWLAANLRNYQIEAVFDKCGDRAGLRPGKSQRQPGPSQTSRKRSRQT